MAYQPLILGSDTTSRESLNSSLLKINSMLAELYSSPISGVGDLFDGGTALLPINDLTINGNDFSAILDGGDADGILPQTTTSTALPTRTVVLGTTGILSTGATADLDISGFKGYVLYKIQTSEAAWVRIYTDNASRTADASRLQGDDPTSGAGVIAEVISTGAQTILISPGVQGFNNEATPTTNVPLSVTNLSGASVAITVSLTLLQTES